MLKVRDIYAINGRNLRGHFLVLLEFLEDNEILFVDTLTGKPLVCDRKNVELALKHIVGHPKHDNLTTLDYIENLPENIFESIKANITVGDVNEIDRF